MAESISYQQTPDQLAQAALEKVRALCKGNGVKASAISIVRHSIGLHTLHAGTYLELKPVVSEREAPGKITSGTMVGSREEATKQIDSVMISAVRDASVRTQIAASLLSRPDKGFGLGGQQIPIDFLKREFTWHDACPTCHGNGQGPCPKCQGRRIEPCIKCSARGLMFCPNCRGTGLLQGVKCQKCFGQRYVPCDMCRKTGMMPCRTCHGHGTSKCASCGGQGWRSHIITLMAGAITYFEYDAKSIPQHAAHMIEAAGAALVKDQKIRLEGRAADDKENAVGANYEVTFPYGDITFALGKKEIACGVFGYKADLVNFPMILEKMVQRGIDDLEEAAAGSGSVGAKIKSATRYRLIAQGVLYAARTTPQKASGLLLKKYDAGLSQSAADHIVTLAETAIARITKKPRQRGLALGIAINAALSAVYFATPVRAFITRLLPDIKFDILIDFIPLLLGGTITLMSVRTMAAGSVQNALGHLVPDSQKKTLIPKAGQAPQIGYAAALILTPVMIELGRALGNATPYWYQYLLGFLQ